MQRIGELAKATKTTTATLRYYESEGLLPRAGRQPNGYRAYPTAAAGRVDFIRRAQALGLSIREIKHLVAEPTTDPARLRRAVAHKLAALESRQAELATLHKDLEAMYLRLAREPALGCGQVGDCGWWLPTEEEVMAMTEEVDGVRACDCQDCPECQGCCGTDCC